MSKLGKYLLLTSLAAVASGAHAAQFKIATLAPEGSAWMEVMRDGARDIKSRTDGRVEIKLYGGGIMGSDKTVLRKMRSGQLHGATFTASGLAERYPDIQLYSLPMLFQSSDEAAFVRARMDQALIDGLADAGLITFGFAQGGFALLMTNKPVRSLDDVKGQKVWVPEGDVPSYQAMAAMGLAPVVLPLTDVLTGLQTGLIDVVANSPVGAVVLQWYTKIKYVTEVPLVYIFGMLVVDKRSFERLTPEDQAAFTEVMTQIYSDLNESNFVDNESASAAMAERGVIGVVAEPAAVAEWREVIMESNRRIVEKGQISADLFDQALDLAIEYRRLAGSNDQAAAARNAQDATAGTDGGQ